MSQYGQEVTIYLGTNNRYNPQGKHESVGYVYRRTVPTRTRNQVLEQLIFSWDISGTEEMELSTD